MVEADLSRLARVPYYFGAVLRQKLAFACNSKSWAPLPLLYVSRALTHVDDDSVSRAGVVVIAATFFWHVVDGVIC